MICEVKYRHELSQADVQAQAQRLTDTQSGKTIKAEGKVSELLQEAMSQSADSTARQLAETLIAQQEVALIELGLELGSQYQVSHAEQLQLIEQATDKVLNDHSLGELARFVTQETSRTASNAAKTIDTGSQTGIDDLTKSGTIKPDRIVEGHASTPKDATPGSVIDRVDSKGKTNIRTFYGENGLKTTEIHTGNHGNCRTHKFGVNGEHAHDYVWDEDGRLKSKEPRELTENERDNNGDIL